MKNLMHKIGIAVIMLFVVWHATALADDNDARVQELRRQIDELTKQADQYKTNIQQKSDEAKTLSSQISILTNQILRIQTQISITSKQIDSTKLEIGTLQDQINTLQQRMERQRGAIGKIVYDMYQKDRTDLLAMLIKSQHLSDFAGQAQENVDVSNSLVDSINQLEQDKKDVEDRQSNLQEKKNSLEGLSQQQLSQKQALDENQRDKNNLLKVTKGQEKEYQKLLSDVEKRQAEFFTELQQLEGQVLKSGAAIVHVTASSIPAKGSKIFKMPEIAGHITQGFGYTAYARRGAYGGQIHNGIDVASGYGTSIYSIGEGRVLASGYNSGFGNFIAIEHSQGLVSIYGHMRAPTLLANGTAITTDTVLGYEGATGNVTGSHVHLSLYKDFFTYKKGNELVFNYAQGTLNPLDYIQR